MTKSPDRFRAEKTDDNLDLYIYDEIGFWGIEARQIADELKRNPDVKRINLYISSPGGSVWDATAIYNLLVRHDAEVYVYIDGIAASAASLIAMAGDRILMAENATMMIHEPSGFVYGTAKDMRDTADVLDKYRDVLALTYAARSKLTKQEALDLMAAETWFTAEEAEENGLADQITPAKSVENSFDLSHFQNVPERLQSGRKGSAKPNPDRGLVPTEAMRLGERIAAHLESIQLTIAAQASQPAAQARQPQGEPPMAKSDQAGQGTAKTPAGFTQEQVDEQITAATTALKAELEKSHTAALATARQEADQAAHARVLEILAKCELAKCKLADAITVVKPNPTIEDATDGLLKLVCKRDTPVGDAGGTDLAPQKPSPEEKYRAEFRAAGGQDKLGVTEDQYVESCIRSDAGGSLKK